LLEHAAQEGVKLRYNSKVVDVNSETVAVTLHSGERIFSDVIIGADGFTSLVRNVVAGQPVPETRERDVSLNFTIPTDVMKAHKDLRSLATNSDVRRLGST
jgi:salicylate hydroxylase